MYNCSMRIRPLLATCSLLFGLSCSPGGNSLRGSISQTFSLDFETVQSKLVGGQGLVIAYVTPIPNTSNFEEAVKIIIDNNAVTITEGESIDLVLYGQLSRFQLIDGTNGQEEDREPFPAMVTGTLTFSSFDYLLGSELSGQFEIRFINGRTLLGEFRTKLEF